MSKIFDEIREEAFQEGEQKSARKSALLMLADGIPCDKVSKYTGTANSITQTSQELRSRSAKVASKPGVKRWNRSENFNSKNPKTVI